MRTRFCVACVRRYFKMRGSAPARRVTFVSAKVTKTIFPERGSPQAATALRALLATEYRRQAVPGLTAVARTSCPRPCGLALLSSVLGSRYGCKNRVISSVSCALGPRGFHRVSQHDTLLL